LASFETKIARNYEEIFPNGRVRNYSRGSSVVAEETLAVNGEYKENNL
jgi:hypothetical protein